MSRHLAVFYICEHSYLPSYSTNFPIANFFTDSNAQTALLNNLIKPFIKTYGSNSNIAAFQLYNELNGIANP